LTDKAIIFITVKQNAAASMKRIGWRWSVMGQRYARLYYFIPFWIVSNKKLNFAVL